jgi:hypothetical protein
MAADAGPTAFFHFAPGQHTGIVRRSVVPCTLQNWTFATWLRLETSSSGAIGGVPLLTLFSADPEDLRVAGTPCPAGAAIILRRKRLIVVSVANDTHRTVLGGSCDIVPRQWHHIVVTVETGVLSGASTVSAYLDGQKIESEMLKMARTESIEFLAVGMSVAMPCTDWPEPLQPLQAQMSVVYLFNQALSATKVKGLYMLGYGYVGTFMGEECLLPEHRQFREVASLFASREAVAQHLVAAYVPCNPTRKGTLLDVSPKGVLVVGLSPDSCCRCCCACF